MTSARECVGSERLTSAGTPAGSLLSEQERGVYNFAKFIEYLKVPHAARSDGSRQRITQVPRRGSLLTHERTCESSLLSNFGSSWAPGLEGVRGAGEGLARARSDRARARSQLRQAQDATLVQSFCTEYFRNPNNNSAAPLQQ